MRLTNQARAWSRAVKEEARRLGFDRVGIAPAGPAPHGQAFLAWLARGYDAGMRYMARGVERRLFPQLILPQVQSLVVVAHNYYVRPPDPALLTDPSRGRIARYAWGLDYHDVLRRRLFALDAFLRELSGREAHARAYVDTGPVLERDWAHRAGVGFVGRNACLIVPGLGSWVFLGVLLVPERLEPDPEPLLLDEAPPRWRFADGAVGTWGRCARCLEVCPTGAFPAPYVVDARRCISYLTIEHRGPIPHELRPYMGNWIFGCDLCQDVCPWNERFAVPTDEPAFQPRPDQVAPPLLDLLRLDEAAFRARYRKAPLYRARRRGLLRNVCVAIGNWGDPQAVPALAEVLAREPEPLVRGHAAWALGRIGTAGAREALLAAWAREEDGDVREEVERALARWG